MRYKGKLCVFLFLNAGEIPKISSEISIVDDFETVLKSGYSKKQMLHHTGDIILIHHIMHSSEIKRYYLRVEVGREEVFTSKT